MASGTFGSSSESGEPEAPQEDDALAHADVRPKMLPPRSARSRIAQTLMTLRSRIELTKAVYTIGAKAIEARREALDCSKRDLLVATPVLAYPVG